MIQTKTTAVTGKIGFAGPTLRISVWCTKKVLKNISDAMKTVFLQSCVPVWWSFVWHERRGLLPNLKRGEELFLPFDVVHIVWRRAVGEKLCSPALFFIPWSSWGFSLSVTTLISVTVPISALWQKLPRHAYCLPANPTVSPSGPIITRYSKEIPGLKSGASPHIISCCRVQVYNTALP